MSYGVFISHGWHDRWIGEQMARCVAEVGAAPFIDIFDIKKGDRIEERVREGLTASNELIAFLTLRSASSTWVWTEAAAAWYAGKRVTGMLYGITLREMDEQYGGTAWLSARNVCSIDEFDDYLGELKGRIGEPGGVHGR
jgi:hypothetical protein